MAGVTVKVQHNILNWVMKKAEDEVVSTSVLELLKKWISGEKTPTFNQIETVSKKVNIPFGYFFLNEPPVEECDIVEYRTIDSVSVNDPSRNLIDTVDMMSNVQEWMAEYNKENLAEGYSFVGRASKQHNVRAVVKDILSELDMPEDWFAEFKNASDAFRYIRSKLTAIGILVMMNGVVGNNTHRKLDIEEFRAFTLIDKYAPLIFINSADTNNGKLFSLLHETVHVWIGKNSFYNDYYGNSDLVGKDEQFCNAVAAEILVPDAFFASKWDELVGDPQERIEELSKYFVCSNFVLLRKALSCKKISRDDYNSLSALYKAMFHKNKTANEKKGSGEDFYRTLNSKWDRRFVLALAASAKSGQTLYSDAYRLTNTTGKTFHELVGKAGGVV